MFRTQSPSWWAAAVLACLLLVSACGPGSEGVDFEGWELEEKEQLLSRLVNHLIEKNGSSIYNMTILQRYSKTIEETLGDRAEISVLEIGPGRNLAVGVMFVLEGKRQYFAVDIYEDPHLYDPIVYQNMHRLAEVSGRKLSGMRFEDVARIENGKIVLDPDRLVWLYPQESYAFEKADGSVDFVFSHSGFEHFNEPEKTIERIFEVLSPGGVTAHSIDLRDHRDFSKPYAFLEYEKATWRDQFSADNLHNYTNRWRAVDFQKAFEEAGFEILEDYRQQEELTEELKATFHSDFQGYSLQELSETYLWIVARKPDPEAAAAEPVEDAAG